MSKLLGILGMTLGGWLGWSLGERLSFAAALFLGILGTALGLYLGRKFAQDRF